MKIKRLPGSAKTADPRLIIKAAAYKTMKNFMATAHSKTKEFMFMGQVTRENMDFIVEQFYLLPNDDCSSAFCSSDDEKYPEWFNSTFKTLEEKKKVRIHAHSHVNMGTSPSGTDNDQINKLINQVGDYFIQFIINHKNENTCNIYDKEKGYIYEDVDQYLEISGQLFMFDKDNKFVMMTSPEIKDGQYKIENSLMCIGDNIFYDFDSHDFMVTEIIENGGVTYYKGEVEVNSSEPEMKAVDDLFKEMVKEKSYGYQYGNGYYGGEYGGDNYWEKNYSEKKSASTKKFEKKKFKNNEDEEYKKYSSYFLGDDD